jgi:hypothetical protein
MKYIKGITGNIRSYWRLKYAVHTVTTAQKSVSHFWSSYCEKFCYTMCLFRLYSHGAVPCWRDIPWAHPASYPRCTGGRRVDLTTHSSPSSANVKNAPIFTFTPPPPTSSQHRGVSLPYRWCQKGGSQNLRKYSAGEGESCQTEEVKRFDSAGCGIVKPFL